MKFQNLSVKRLFGRVAMELVLSMSGITIALFLVTKQIAVLLTGGALLLCAIVGIGNSSAREQVVLLHHIPRKQGGCDA